MSVLRRFLLAAVLALVAGLASMSVAAATSTPPPAASPNTATVTVTAKVAGPYANQTSPPTKTWVIRADDPVSLIGVSGPIGILAQYACDDGTLSAFHNGDKGKWKICPERDSNNFKWRAHAAVWCDDANLNAVKCLVIDGTTVKSELNRNTVTVQTKGPNYYQDVVNGHIKNFDSPWACYGTSLASFQALYYHLRVTARSGEEGTEKNKFSKPTGNMGGC